MPNTVCDGIYRGDFGDTGRAPHAGCPHENQPRAAPGLRCDASEPLTGTGWFCLRPRGHAGDHVAVMINGRVRVRWDPADDRPWDWRRFT